MAGERNRSRGFYAKFPDGKQLSLLYTRRAVVCPQTERFIDLQSEQTGHGLLDIFTKQYDVQERRNSRKDSDTSLSKYAPELAKSADSERHLVH